MVEHYEDFKSLIKMDPYLFCKILQRFGFQLRKVLGPYVTECFRFLIKNGFIMSSFTRFINIDKLLLLVGLCTKVREI